MRSTVPTLLLLVLPLCACAPLQGSTGSSRSDVRILTVKRQQRLSQESLLSRLAGADVVLLGEQHDNPRHHRLQARVIDGLVSRGRRPAIVFEMLQRDQQRVVDDTRAKSPNDVDALAKAVAWSGSGWPQWRFYRPVFAAAYRNDLPIIAGNLPREAVRGLVRDGAQAVAAAERHELGLDLSLPADERAGLLQELRESHCGLLPEQLLPRMAIAQRARDGAIARAAINAASSGRSVVIITGNGHARTDRAIPWVLHRLAPELAVAALSFYPVESGRQISAEALGALPYDYVWLTPAVEHEDPCAPLRRRRPNGDSDRQ